MLLVKAYEVKTRQEIATSPELYQSKSKIVNEQKSTTKLTPTTYTML